MRSRHIRDGLGAKSALWKPGGELWLILGSVSTQTSPQAVPVPLERLHGWGETPRAELRAEPSFLTEICVWQWRGGHGQALGHFVPCFTQHRGLRLHTFLPFPGSHCAASWTKAHQPPAEPSSTGMGEDFPPVPEEEWKGKELIWLLYKKKQRKPSHRSRLWGQRSAAPAHKWPDLFIWFFDFQVFCSWNWTSFKLLWFFFFLKSASMVIFFLNHWGKHLSIPQKTPKKTICSSNHFPSQTLQADTNYRKFHL